MLTFSTYCFYGIMGVKETGNLFIFINFMHDFIIARFKIIGQGNSNFVLVMDNSSIHVNKELEKYLKGTSISILTISTYSPSLNP